ncbi:MULTISPECIES: metallopeptidase [unclassified Nocardia]|uniref:metallopeptidase n=1 Tax=unclassified Nocardia TaxID=2637762 RepID=UPI001CE46AE4|nr:MULTISPECIES: metallopeptidase [unclassified Nocardia]
MTGKRLRFAALAVLLMVTAAATGCGKTATVGTPATPSSAENPWQLAAGAASNAGAKGPNGPRPGVPDANRTAENGDGGQYDKLSLDALADLDEFWTTEYGKNFSGTFTPVTRYISWDANASKEKSVTFCRANTYHVVNAAYCDLDHTIGWDRGVLLPALVKRYGPMSVVMVLAHEYGHSVQSQAKLNGYRTPTLVLEQQADCFAGVFMRQVAEGKSKHFTLNTTDGLNSVLATTVAVRDKDPNNPKNVHGSAFERVTALQIGWNDGAPGCKKIDKAEITQRRGTLPTTFEPGDQDQQLPVDQPSLTLTSQALAKIFPLKTPPQYDFSGLVRNCPQVTPTDPVSYCPNSNKIGVDLPTLAKRGASMVDKDPLGATVSGNYAAFVVFISRYVLAVEQDRKLSLTGADTAGLRTACLSGVATAKLADPSSDPRLTAGDLDAAVSGLLADGAAAADVDGKVAASGYERLEAFRSGVLDGESACLSKYK